MKSSGNSYFKKVDRADISKILKGLTVAGNELVVTDKNKVSTTLKVLDYDLESKTIIAGKININIDTSELTVQFEFKGMLFFVKCELSFGEKGESVLQLKDDIYKCERRKNFRLNVSISHNAKIFLDFGKKEADILETPYPTLFHEFLDVVKSLKEVSFEGNVGISLVDISASGVSFHVSAKQSEAFEELDTFSNVLLNFNNKVFEIPEVKFVYKHDIQVRSEAKVKIALKFSSLPASEESRLRREIISEVKESDVKSIMDLD